ncbi:response regulator [Roseibium marinum]|uniref:Response regulator receiver domain-containing protein n=1 Tax=Roseibium marinum TaxID=281252 RepID=A0A2S3UXH6_9HYPH|nr:response regulator [Roseibium marinum]POF32290.1 response regulator receiver domain-containing protein [Roseibium marinum]
MPEKLTRILFVEDDESIAQVVMMTLEDLGGFNAKHCDSGSKALETVIEFAPQLILMDVMMPKMSGPETLEHLRKMPGAKDIPVVFMTAKAQIHEQEAYMKLGAAGIIVKPFDPMTLSAEITSLWDRFNTDIDR